MTTINYFKRAQDQCNPADPMGISCYNRLNYPFYEIIYVAAGL